MDTISIVVPTHNRPELLIEAIESIFAQTRRADEIVVVDDGSAPAVDESALQQRFDRTIETIRNDAPVGIARVRKIGAAAARGTFIAQLDDDDKYAPETLQCIFDGFQCRPDVDFLLLNVEGFGPQSDRFMRAQKGALNKILDAAITSAETDGIVEFENNRLFRALLNAVPCAFQHAVGRRDQWYRINELTDEAWQIRDTISEIEQANINQLNECEWALYAAATSKLALITRPLYLTRCGHERFYSVPQAQESQTLAATRIKHGLLRMAQRHAALANFPTVIKSAYAKSLFNLEYQQFHQKKAKDSRTFVKRAISVDFHFKYLMFLLRTFLP